MSRKSTPLHLRRLAITVGCLVLGVLVTPTPASAFGRRCAQSPQYCPPPFYVQPGPVFITDPCCEAELQKCRARVKCLEKEVHDLQHSLSVCVQERDALAKELEKVKCERDGLKEKVRVLEEQLTKCEKELKSTKRRLAKLMTELTACKCDLEKAMLKIASLNKDLHDCQTELKDCEKQREQFRSERDDARKDVAVLRERIDGCKREKEQADLTIKEVRERLASCEKEQKDTHIQLTQTKVDLQKCRDEAAGFAKDLEHTREELHKADKQVAVFSTWVYVLVVAALLLLILLFCWAAYCRSQGAGLHLTARDLRDQHDRDLQRIRELDALSSAARAQAEQLQIRVRELELNNQQSGSLVNEYRLARSFAEQQAAVANERALGAAREMAANKKDCYPCPPASPAVVYGPITTPNGPVNMPTTTVPGGAVVTTPVVSTTPVSTAPGVYGSSSTYTDRRPGKREPDDKTPGDDKPDDKTPGDDKPDVESPDGKVPVFPIIKEDSGARGSARVQVDEDGVAQLFMSVNAPAAGATTRYVATVLITGYKDDQANNCLTDRVEVHTLTCGSNPFKKSTKDASWFLPSVKPEDAKKIRHVRVLLVRDKSEPDFVQQVIGCFEKAGQLVDAADTLYKKVADSELGQAVALAAAGA